MIEKGTVVISLREYDHFKETEREYLEGIHKMAYLKVTDDCSSRLPRYLVTNVDEINKDITSELKRVEKERDELYIENHRLDKQVTGLQKEIKQGEDRWEYFSNKWWFKLFA